MLRVAHVFENNGASTGARLTMEQNERALSTERSAFTEHKTEWNKSGRGTRRFHDPRYGRGYGLWAMGYGLRATGYELRVTGYGLRASAYGLQATTSYGDSLAIRSDIALWD